MVTRSSKFLQTGEKTVRLPLDQRIKMSSWIDDNGCWIWKFRPNKGGYGRIQLSGDRRGKFLA
jgi:hypothetical protein